MELRKYVEIVMRRWWMVALITLIAFGASVYMRPERIPQYKITIKLAVKPPSQPPTDKFFNYDGYYGYVVTEYLNDDIAEIVKSGDFMQDLRNRLKDRQGGPPGGYIEARKAHRVLTLTVTSGSEEDGKAIASETARMLQDDKDRYFGGIADHPPAVLVVDEPSVAIAPAPARDAVDIFLRTLLGFIAGLMLAFLLEYLDDTLRNAGEVKELLGVPVLAELPAEGKRNGRKVAPGPPAAKRTLVGVGRPR